MSAVVSDVLQTRLELVGLSSWVSGFQEAADATGLLEGKLDDNQKRLLSFGVASGAVAAGGLAFFGKAALAAADESAKFQRAAGNFKGSFPADELADFAAEMQSLTGVGDDVTADFLGLLGTFKLTGAQAKELALPILNAAEALKAQGASTEGLSLALGKAIEAGSTDGLRRMGVIIEDAGFKTASTSERVKILAKVLNEQGGDAALRFRKELPGAMQAAGNAIGDVEEALGGPLIPLLNTGANAVEKLAKGFTDLPAPVQTTVSLLGVGLAGAFAIYSASTLFAFGATVKLAKAHLEAAKNAKKQTEEEKKLGDTVAETAAKETIAAGAAKAKGGAGAAATIADIAAGAAGPALSQQPTRFSRFKDFLNLKSVGRLGGAAALAGGVALDLLPDSNDSLGDVKRVGSRALEFGGTGALLGSVVPGVGNVAGGLIGALIGTAVGGVENYQKAAGKGGEKSGTDQLLEEQNKILSEIRDKVGDKQPFDTRTLPGRDQALATDLALMFGS